jgi:hypothetical protein
MDRPGPGPTRHPDRHDLERFMQGRLSREETRNVVRHLLTGCPECLQVTRPLWRFGDQARLKMRKGRAACLETGDEGLESLLDERETVRSESQP